MTDFEKCLLAYRVVARLGRHRVNWPWWSVLPAARRWQTYWGIDDNRLLRLLDQVLPLRLALGAHLKQRYGELFREDFEFTFD